MPPPPENKALLRDYENPLVSLNKALLGPYLLGDRPEKKRLPNGCLGDLLGMTFPSQRNRLGIIS